jgi:hypothetical protein
LVKEGDQRFALCADDVASRPRFDLARQLLSANRVFE